MTVPLRDNADFERPIMAARQPDASSKQRQEGAEAQETLAAIRSHFVLRRENSVIMQHLPAKCTSCSVLRGQGPSADFDRWSLTAARPQTSTPSSFARRISS